MARIRTIKPDFWTDGKIISLSFEARLFYIGMWNFVCDRGHIADDPLGLKLKILPNDAVNGSDLVDALVSAGLVRRIEIPDGRVFLEIPRFPDHQKVDARWNSRCPACAQPDSPKLTETHPNSPQEGKGREGKGKEGRGKEVAEATPPTRTCGKHDGWEHGERCGACGRDRRAHEAHEAEQGKAAAARKREAQRNPTCPHGFPRHESCERCGDSWPG